MKHTLTMTARYIGSTPATTTLINKTSTTYHFFEVEGFVFRVEANCTETPENLTPISVHKFEVQTMELGTALEAVLKKDFGL